MYIHSQKLITCFYKLKLHYLVQQQVTTDLNVFCIPCIIHHKESVEETHTKTVF